MIDISKVKTIKHIDVSEHFKRDDYLVTRYADGDTITMVMDCFLEVIEYLNIDDYDHEPVWTHKGIGCAVKRYGQTLILPPPEYFNYNEIAE